MKIAAVGFFFSACLALVVGCRTSSRSPDLGGSAIERSVATGGASADKGPNSSAPLAVITLSPTAISVPTSLPVNAEPAVTPLATVEVHKPKLVAYAIRAIQSSDNIEYGSLVLIDERTSRGSSATIKWIEPGHWRKPIVAIEGKPMTSLTLRQALHTINYGAEPIHLTVRSRSGSEQIVECYSRPRD